MSITGVSATAGIAAAAALAPVNPVAAVGAASTAVKGAGKVVDAHNEHTVENTTAAESRIRDTDMASEMVKYTKESMLQQVTESIMAQANQSKQGVLSLLQ